MVLEQARGNFLGFHRLAGLDHPAGGFLPGRAQLHPCVEARPEPRDANLSAWRSGSGRETVVEGQRVPFWKARTKGEKSPHRMERVLSRVLMGPRLGPGLYPHPVPHCR